jgi:hypothetical protein
MAFEIIMRSHLTALLLAITLTACQATPVDQVATISLPDEVTISILRTPSHPTLAEYKRIACLARSGKRLTCWDLFPDTGGTHRTNVYREASGQIFLQDRISSYAIDLTLKKLIEVEAAKVSGTYLGCFNQDGGGVWRFLPVKDSPEVKIVEDGSVE